MTDEEKNLFRNKLYELRLKQVYYIIEHRQTSAELAESIKEVKHEYAKELFKEKEGEIEHVEHKRK